MVCTVYCYCLIMSVDTVQDSVTDILRINICLSIETYDKIWIEFKMFKS